MARSFASLSSLPRKSRLFASIRSSECDYTHTDDFISAFAILFSIVVSPRHYTRPDDDEKNVSFVSHHHSPPSPSINQEISLVLLLSNDFQSHAKYIWNVDAFRTSIATKHHTFDVRIRLADSFKVGDGHV